MYKPEGFSLDIFKSRYAFTEDETWEQACDRVARQVALAETPDKVDKYKDKFKHILENNYFVPGGRIWYNSGRPNPQLLNCFVLNDELDSKEGWGNLSKEMIITSMCGGGIGTDFSDVRPSGATINGQKGAAPGPLGLMELINNNGYPVRAGGARRVALMMSLDLDHPDVEAFLDYKLTQGKLQLANVSVRSGNTKKFIKAIKEDGDWELSWKGKYKKIIKAKDLWNTIVTNAYNSAEPGFLNLELAEEESNIHYIEKLSTTNPCFTGEMLLKTEYGFKTFNELNNTNFKAFNVNNELVDSRVWSNGIKNIVKLVLSNNEIIRCTSDHKFMLNNGEECPAIDLKSKRLMPSYVIRQDNDEFVKLGFIQGDGSLTRLNSESHKGLEVHIGEKDQDIADLFNINYDSDRRSYYLTGFNDVCKDLQFSAKPLPERVLPLTYQNWTKDQKSSFLRGVYSANGSIIKKGRISFKTTCLDLVNEIKNTLLNDFNIDSYITTNKTKEIKFNNGTYLCKESYDLNIGKFYDVIKFAKNIAFVHRYKNDTLDELIKNKSPMVLSVKDDGIEEVFDFNLNDNTHWGVVSTDIDSCGYIAHNCGEIFLSPYDCCCLGHLVLPRFINDKNDIDWHLMAETIKYGVRLLDNVLTVNTYPLPEMKDKSHKLRRIGLGATGLADMLAMLGYEYGNSESIEFIDKLFKFIAKASYEASVMLAVEKGAFPACNPSEHIKSGYMKRMPKKIRSLVEEHGIRNCAILTIAPTGTVSILSGNISSGIEPMFAPAYERRYWDNEIRKTELVFHPLFKQFLDDKRDINHFKGSRDLTVKQHLEVQKVVQKWVDNATSKTINIPENYPIEEVEKLWLEYLPHLKGTTFYKENSRGYVDENGVLHEPPLVALSLEDAKNKYTKDSKTGKDDNDCPSGVCDI